MLSTTFNLPDLTDEEIGDLISELWESGFHVCHKVSGKLSIAANTGRFTLVHEILDGYTASNSDIDADNQGSQESD